MSELVIDSLKGIYKATAWLYGQNRLSKEIGARFATSREIRKIVNSSNRGVLVDGKNKRLSEKSSFQAIGIFSPPGKGKTSSYIIPNILDKASQNCSILVSDPSGEIYRQTSGHMKSKNYTIHLINPTNINTSSLFNPFEGLDHNNMIEIGAICTSIVMSKYGSDKEQVWNEGAIGLLELFAKCLAYSCPEKLNLPNLNYLVLKFGSDGKALDDWIVENSYNPSMPEDTSIIDEWKSIVANDSKMLQSFITILKVALKYLNNRQIQSLFYNDDIDLKNFRKKKTIIYISLKENQLKYYQFLIDLFYTKFFSVMTDKEPSKNDLDIYCFLDEFGNSYVDGFSTTINTIRKYRVSLSLVFQNISQITAKYGQEEGKSIKSAISNYIIYSGADIQTTREQSDKIGKRILQQKRSFEDPIQQYTQIDLLPPEKIRTLESNELLFISGNNHPFILETTPFYKSYSRFNSASKKTTHEIQAKNRKPINKLVIK